MDYSTPYIVIQRESDGLYIPSSSPPPHPPYASTSQAIIITTILHSLLQNRKRLNSNVEQWGERIHLLSLASHMHPTFQERKD